MRPTRAARALNLNDYLMLQRRGTRWPMQRFRTADCPTRWPVDLAGAARLVRAMTPDERDRPHWLCFARKRQIAAQALVPIADLDRLVGHFADLRAALPPGRRSCASILVLRLWDETRAVLGALVSRERSSRRRSAFTMRVEAHERDEVFYRLLAGCSDHLASVSRFLMTMEPAAAIAQGDCGHIVAQRQSEGNLHRRRAEYHAAMKRKWQFAARYAWLPAWPDSPAPG